MYGYTDGWDQSSPECEKEKPHYIYYLPFSGFLCFMRQMVSNPIWNRLLLLLQVSIQDGFPFRLLSQRKEQKKVHSLISIHVLSIWELTPRIKFMNTINVQNRSFFTKKSFSINAIGRYKYVMLIFQRKISFQLFI